MKIGIDILGVDEPGRIINFVNSYKDEEVELSGEAPFLSLSTPFSISL